MSTYVRAGDDGAPEVINVDLALAEGAPDPSRPWLLTVDVPLLRPDAHGLRDASEMDAVGAIDDGLAAALAPLDAVVLGRRTARGSTTFWWQAARAEGFEKLVARAMQAQPAYSASAHAASDPGWETYLESLCPDARQRMTIHRDEVRMRLAELGDVAELPRPVDHFAFFATREAAEAASRVLGAQGFETASLVDDATGERPWHLHVRRTHAVAMPELAEICDAVFDAAEEQDGEYDGWGCGVTRPPEPEKRKSFLGRLFGR